MSSQHPRRRTIPDDLFRGLASFRELEGRIARLPEELERGDERISVRRRVSDG